MSTIRPNKVEQAQDAFWNRSGDEIAADLDDYERAVLAESLRDAEEMPHDITASNLMWLRERVWDRLVREAEDDAADRRLA